jgi:hypothetical protein
VVPRRTLAIGVALALTAVFGRGRRPATRDGPLGAALRGTGLVPAVAGAPRTGTALVVARGATPPRSTVDRASSLTPECRASQQTLSDHTSHDVSVTRQRDRALDP